MYRKYDANGKYLGDDRAYKDMGFVTQFNAPVKYVDVPTPMPRPALGDVQNDGVLTQNRRNNAMLAIPKRPDMRISLADQLMSIGGAGLMGARDGALSSLGGMIQQKDALDEVNRSAALAQYQDEMARVEAERKARFEQQKQDDLMRYRMANLEAKNKPKAAKPDKDLESGIASYDQAISKMEMALSDLRGGMQLTGLIDGTIGALWDRVQGNPEATSRLLLQELKVDSALLTIAQTKGAISNQEMKLFLSPTPDIRLDDEKTWIDWIDRRMGLAKTIRNRLVNGTSVEDPATEDQVNQFSTTSTPQSNGGGEVAINNPEDQALLDKYKD